MPSTLCTKIGLILCLLSIQIEAQHPDYDFNYRLPTLLTPLIYDLKLIFSSYSEDVLGHVEIQIQCENETDFIELHASPLFIVVQNTSLENRLSGELFKLGLPISNSHRQTLRFDLPTILQEKHVYYLSFHFTTKYSFDDRGLIRSKDGVRGTWFNTLFEPSHARRLFPSFDEPHWRSSFKLELEMVGEYGAEDMIALSCMETEKVIRNDNSTIWHFVATPPIPTYLFTIAAGRFRSECNSSYILGKEICIWRFTYMENWEPMAQNLIKAIAKFQAQMTDYLLSDPIARLHFIMLPSKLSGMENFGLLNMKESLWPNGNDKRSLQLFAKTLYHEMTHQWFGNLVTMKWWDDIWLAESLTNFLASFKPLAVELQNDQSTDSLVSKKWASGIPSIAYSKGAIIMEMLNSIIGTKQMRRLLRQYLHIHQFGYATTDTFSDVLRTITSDQIDSNEVTAVEFVSSWLHQPGYPIVFINYDETVHQFIFTQTPKMVSNMTAPKIEWQIPIWTSCQIKSQPDKIHWLKPGKSLALNLLDITKSQNKNAVIFNLDKVVYYKLTYLYK